MQCIAAPTNQVVAKKHALLQKEFRILFRSTNDKFDEGMTIKTEGLLIHNATLPPEPREDQSPQ